MFCLFIFVCLFSEWCWGNKRSTVQVFEDGVLWPKAESSIPCLLELGDL